jgi:hypothetical protein
VSINTQFKHLTILGERTDMNSDAPYESAVRTSLIPHQGRKSWGQLPCLLLKIEGGGGNSYAPLFGIKFKKKNFFKSMGLSIGVPSYVF